MNHCIVLITGSRLQFCIVSEMTYNVSSGTLNSILTYLFQSSEVGYLLLTLSHTAEPAVSQLYHRITDAVDTVVTRKQSHTQTNIIN